MSAEPIVIVGAGPVGLVAATVLARAELPVVVLEAEPELPHNLRASTFHPPTLDMLDDLGAAESLIAQGLRAPRFQYRGHREGLIAEFDFALLGSLTRHPFRVQCEQYKLNEILLGRLRRYSNVEVRFSSPVHAVKQDEGTISAEIAVAGTTTRVRGRYLIGADGASSPVRGSLGIPFEGFTWPERFLVASTPFDYTVPIPDLTAVNYVADPEEWYFLLRVPGVWRVMFPTRSDESDTEVMSHEAIQRRLRRVHDPGGDVEVVHRTLYRVHQRIAKHYRHGRGFLAGDAAHINNPLGGMGMNGGIHDAMSLATKLARVCREEASPELLDDYELERRPVALEYVNEITIRNKRNLETGDPEEQAAFREQLRAAGRDPARGLDLLKRVSMIASLESGPSSHSRPA